MAKSIMDMKTFSKYAGDLRSVNKVIVDGQGYLRVDNIQGSIMYLPRHDNNISWGTIFYGCWEPWETEFVKRAVRSGMCCIDVGTFIGYYTLLMAKLTGNNGRVYGFEPNAEAYEALQHSVRANSYTNTTLYSCLVGNKRRVVKYNSNNLVAGSQGIDVQMHALDDVLLGSYGFVKIDTEGHDFEVLRGMQRIIAKSKDIVILIEYCPALWERFENAPRDFVKFAKDMGLRVDILAKDKQLVRFSESDLEYDSFYGLSVEQLVKQDDLYSTSLVLTKKTRIAV